MKTGQLPQVTIHAPIVNFYLTSAGVTSADLTAALAPLLERLAMAETGLEAVTREVAETGAAIDAAVTAVNAATANMNNAASEMTQAAGLLPALQSALAQALANAPSDANLKAAADTLDAFQTKLVSATGTLGTAGQSLSDAGAALASALSASAPAPAPEPPAPEPPAPEPPAPEPPAPGA